MHFIMAARWPMMLGLPTVQTPCYTAFHFTAYTVAELKIGMEELS